MRAGNQKGLGLVEVLVSATILLLILSGVATMLIQGSRINKSQQTSAELQASARNCLSMVVQKLRSAGWDPLNAGVGIVTLDADLGDDISEIEVFADLNADGLTDGQDEQMLIRHSGDRIMWRRTSNPVDPFVVLAVNISNDADGDGTPEPMFVPDSTIDPTRVTVQITAQSPAADPATGEFTRYTVSSDVVLRGNL